MHLLIFLPFAVMFGTAATCAATSAIIALRCGPTPAGAGTERPHTARPFRPVLVHARFSPTPPRRQYQPVQLRLVR